MLEKITAPQHSVAYSNVPKRDMISRIHNQTQDGSTLSAYDYSYDALGLCTYHWNANNRLIEVKLGSVSLATYAYDHQGRRISKYTPQGITQFVYDGWNLLAEYQDNSLKNSYLWGLDLSGSFQGAGGVGGLLSVSDENGTTYYATYDGNGNVSEYLNEDGETTAHYEFDPFGSTSTQSGDRANDFSFKFSTKYQDSETSFYYYGYRYYDTVTGRWLNRDPLGEPGHELIKGVSESVYTYADDYLLDAEFFLDLEHPLDLVYEPSVYRDNGTNLYHFVFNDPVNNFDVLGEHPAAWAVVVIGGKWVLKKVLRGLGKKAAQRELKRRKQKAAKCAAIHVQYKATEKNCRKCNSTTSASHNNTNCACWTSAVAGRTAYLQQKCDYYLPGSVAAGSKAKENTHKQELASKSAAMAACCACAIN